MNTSTASRSKPGFVNIHEPGDYPIILGDSLKEVSRPQSKFTQVRYNWEPKNGFQRQKGSLKQSNNDLHLAYQEDDVSPPNYTYDGHVTHSKNTKEDQSTSQLVLIFDEAKSAFVLERITTSINMNVTSAPNQTKDDIKRHKQLREPPSKENIHGSNKGEDIHHDEEEEADPSNPYDFRNFLVEAKKSAERGTQAGSRTPIPGSGTPISRVASPSLGAGKFANTSSFRPTPTSAPPQKRKPAENGFKSSTPTTATKKPIQPKRKDGTSLKQSSQPLSKARISDSDEEASDTITVNNPTKKGHTRVPSTNSYPRSPQIIINDPDDLEVDLGSPPPTRKSKGSGKGIDPRTFNSKPQPQLQTTKPKTTSHKPISKPNSEIDIVMPDASSDSSPSDPHFEQESDQDHDVEQLELGSPQDQNQDQDQAVPTPPLQTNENEDEDEDEDLMAVFDAALAEEEEAGYAGSAAGNGNGGTQGYGTVVVEDESEVSEEE